MHVRAARGVILFVLSVLWVPRAGIAQTITGSILGVVTDSSGAVVVGASVAAVNTGTGESRKTQTSNAGQYSIPALPPGDYRLVVELTGFKRFERTPIRVDVLQDLLVDVSLVPGDVTEAVEVTGESPLLETANAALGQVVDNRKIVDLPLSGRDVMALVALTPGVTPGTSQTFGGTQVLQNPYATGNFSVNSGIQSQSESLIDGVPNNVYLWNAPAFVPSVDAVAEFKVQTNNFSAEFGHTGGGIINIITQSGSNAFHLTLFEFFRNNHLDANNFFNNSNGQSIPAYTYNQFGFSTGGPVLLPRYNGRNKTFFFFNYEGFREHNGSTILITVPSAMQHAGDFSQTRNAAGAPVIIYDPLTVHATPGAGSGNQRDPFPGNVIPQRRFDPAAAKLISLWSLPNLPGSGPAQINNFVSNPSTGNTQDQWTTRLDHNFNDRNHLFGRISFERQLPGDAEVFNTTRGALPTTQGTTGATALLIRAWNTALNHTWIVSPSTLLDFRYGFTRQTQFRDPASLGIDLTGLGFSPLWARSVPLDALPTLNPQGFQSVGEGGNILFRRGDNVHSGLASLSKTLGRQSISAGFEFRTFLFNDTREPTGSGAFVFNNAFTQADPLRAAANAGNSLASFLLGLPASGNVQYYPAVSFHQNYFAGYVQDDIRVSASLTFNLGVRYEVETPKTERYNRLSSFDPTAVSPLAQLTGLNLHGGLRFMGVDGVSRGQWGAVWHNVSPRFGFAWRATPKTVIRGGYGVFFNSTVGQGGLVGYGNDGFAATSPMVTTLDGGITPANFLNNPYPQGFVRPPGSSLGLSSQLGQTISPWNSNFPNAYTQQYNFGVQRELPAGFLAGVAFVGSHTTGMFLQVPLTQLPPQVLALGPSLLNQVANPFYGRITSGPLSAPTVAQQRLLAPFPQFSAINFYTPLGQDTYESLQVQAQRRFSSGVGFQLSYTFGKALTDAGATGIFSFNQPTIQNYYDMRGEKSLSPSDVSSRVVFSLQWELPFGKGKPILGGAGRFTNAVVGGWQINTIGTMQTGLPLGLTNVVNQTNALGGTSRPNIAPGASPNLPAGQQSIGKWFNTSVFSQPAPFTFGNVARTLPSTRAPGSQDFDLSLFKNNRMGEKWNLQLRFEAFNVINRANFYSPGVAFGNPQFGVINSTGPARILQVAVKLIF